MIFPFELAHCLIFFRYMLSLYWLLFFYVLRRIHELIVANLYIVFVCYGEFIRTRAMFSEYIIWKTQLRFSESIWESAIFIWKLACTPEIAVAVICQKPRIRELEVKPDFQMTKRRIQTTSNNENKFLSYFQNIQPRLI